MSIKREVNYRSEQHTQFGISVGDGTDTIVLREIGRSPDVIFAFTPDEALAVSELLAAAAHEAQQGKQGPAKVRRFRSPLTETRYEIRGDQVFRSYSYASPLTQMKPQEVLDGLANKGIVEITDAESGQEGKTKWRYFKLANDPSHPTRWRYANGLVETAGGLNGWSESIFDINTLENRSNDNALRFVEVAENE